MKQHRPFQKQTTQATEATQTTSPNPSQQVILPSNQPSSTNQPTKPPLNQRFEKPGPNTNQNRGTSVAKGKSCGKL